LFCLKREIYALSFSSLTDARNPSKGKNPSEHDDDSEPQNLATDIIFLILLSKFSTIGAPCTTYT
jgi:hypothetical protein